MRVYYLHYLPKEFRATAAALYYHALKPRVAGLLGNEVQALALVNEAMQGDHCVVAVVEGKLVGVLGLRVNGRQFVRFSLSSMTRQFGWLSGLLRWLRLKRIPAAYSQANYFVDGMVVEASMRGYGIGSQLMTLAEKQARSLGAERLAVSAEQPDNCDSIYRQLGFEAIEQRSRKLFGRDAKGKVDSETTVLEKELTS